MQWTNKEVEKLLRLSKGFKEKDLAIVMGKTHPSIKAKLKEIGVKSKWTKTGNRRKFYAEDIANIFELKDQGFSEKEISKCFNVIPKTINVVYNLAKRQGLEAFPKR